MVDDGDTCLYHEHQQLVDLVVIWCKITCTSAMFKDLLGNLPQLPTWTNSLQPTTIIPMLMTTFASTDDNDDEPCNNDHQQTVNLLAIQWEICDLMTSISFFTSLITPGDKIVYNKEHSYNQLTSIAQMAKPMTMTTMAYHFIKLCSPYEYITMLCTPDCFVPLWLLTQTRPCLNITSYLSTHTPALTKHACRCCGDNHHWQLFHLALLLPNVMHHALYLLITHVLTVQLDCPLDQPPTCHTPHIPPQSALLTWYPACNNTQFILICKIIYS